MLKNYIKIAFRTIAKQRAYAFINIFGLAVGMAATILILLFVQDELSYDEYHTKSDQIYRVSREWLNAEGETSLHLGHCAPPFGPLLQNDFEGIIEEAVRIGSAYSPLIVYENKRIEENKFYLADANVFKVFSWDLIEGDPETALVEPGTVVLTESSAKKYFGEENAMGKELMFNNFGMSFPLKVTGITKDVPLNSHFTWDIMGSFATIERAFGRENMMQNWGSNNYATYLLLPKGYNPAELEIQFGGFFDKHMQMNEGRKPSETNRLHLMPITDIHLHSHLDSEIEPNGDIAYIYIYGAIAIFTLIIACINFMNLATARSTKRAKEVGLRKVMGAYRSALIRQFMMESIIFAILGLVVGLGLVFLVLPYFNEFIGKQLSLDFIGNNFIFLLMVGVVLFVGLVAGSYPALFLSKFQAASVLKGAHKSTGQKFNLRSALVVLQFFISIALITSVGIVQGQLDYMRTKNLGFNQNHTMVLPSSDTIYNHFETLKTRFERQPGIKSVTLASRVPSGRLLDSQGASAEVDGDMRNLTFRIADVHIDHTYLSSLEVEFVAGRDFDPNLASDSLEAFVINEATVRGVGWDSAEEAIGKSFRYGNRNGQIIGVVKDFHFESLHQSIAPIAFLITNGRARSVIVKYDIGKKDEVESYLKEQWSYLREGFPFDFYELSDRFSNQYESEDRLAKVVTWFSLLAVFIAALGLFGLASFITERRIKEIGIRKVMGATVLQVLVLLTRGFTFLVLIALVLAGPVAYFGMESWLDNFAYQGPIKPWPFIVAGGFALVVAWLTVSFQTIRAARSNPADSLRYE
ncbi:ABC transporter permease [Fulvivirga sp. RKSG066]|uniref:ABC transporter permease n=1 Tax=Fulvivirga aurantia TaxID=2529383 RepID=UPI0012BB5B17|nr:ABC transporter permease [Fulvivirga aurantia]MTI22354.1 ABC transporter permease [Fulvivirga aurantia]